MPAFLLGCLFLGPAALTQCSSPERSWPNDPDTLFVEHVVPALRSACEGCHFPGGEMYSTFPFDESEILLQRVDEILVRLEGRPKKLVRFWSERAAERP